MRNGVTLNRGTRHARYLGNASFAFWLLGVCKVSIVENVIINTATEERIFQSKEKHNSS